MLSDLTYSTDFLNNRIISVDTSSTKRKWNEAEELEHSDVSVLQYKTQNLTTNLEEHEVYQFSTRFQTEFNDRVPFVECARTLASSFEKSGPIYASTDEQNIYASLPEVQYQLNESKADNGNREELSTPVTITPLDTSLLLHNSNYLYGAADEMPSNINGSGCYAFDQSANSTGLIVPGIEDSLDGISTNTTRLEFDLSSDTTSAYAFAAGSVKTGKSADGSNLINLTNSSPCASLFWLDDPGRSQMDTNYEGPNPSMEIFQSTHSEMTQSETHVASMKDSLPPDTQDEIYLACEPQAEPGKLESIIPYIEDRNAETIPCKRSDETPDARRDRVTGKFKQNVVEHSSTAEKLCKVCNDRAVNHNFGQLTCESCKAFFRRNAHKELTCTLKTGEHEITPTTRRECPACRLKKCFRVGMRPELIQVRKKDGSKPRWLEKVPSAAIVHEKHLQSADTNCWTSSTTKGKSNNGGDPSSKQQQQPKEYREDVCSTDSGSCISVETASAVLDTTISAFGGKRSKLVETIDLVEFGTTNEPMEDVSRNSAFDFCSGLTVCDQNKQQPFGVYPTTTGLLPTNQLITTIPASTEKQQPILFQPDVTAALPNVMPGIPNRQTTAYEVGPPIESSNSTCLNANGLSSSGKLEPVNGLEDFILLANTPRLIVPTNMVTIGTASTIDQSPINSIQPFPRTFGINMNSMEISPSQPLSTQLQYATYAKFSQEQPLQTISSSNVVIDSLNHGIPQPLLTSIWNSNTTPPLSNGIIQVGTQKEPIAQTLVSTLPKCVLASSIQPLQQISNTTMVESIEHGSPLPFKPVTVTGATSICFSVQSVPTSVSAVALTAVLPSGNSLPTHIVPQSKVIPKESSMFMAVDSQSHSFVNENNSPSSSAATAALVASSTPSSFLLTNTSSNPASYIGVVSAPINWTPNNPGRSTATESGYSQLTLTAAEPKKIPETMVPSITNLPYMQWTTTANLVEKIQLSTASAVSGINVPSASIVPMVVDSAQSSQDAILIPCKLDDVNSAWTAMWRKGEFPNPENINLQIDIGSCSSLSWRLTLANIWDDIFLRRISVFAVALFGPLCSINADSLQMTDASTDSKISENPRSNGITCSRSSFTPIAEVISDNQKTGQSQPFLTWHDLLWLAKHRFANCVPILLIGCLNLEENDDLCAQFSDCLPSKQNADQVSAGWDNQTACDKRALNVVPSWISKDSCSKEKNLSAYMNETHKGIRAGETYGATLTSVQTGTTPTQTMIQFRCNPGGSVLLSLTRLSQCLSQLTVKAVRKGATEHSEKLAYPILQYLDAYIAQFGSFLAHQPSLMGAFLALKLTDPQFETESVVSGKPIHNGFLATDQEERKERFRKLHNHFVRIFSEAADIVALNESRRLSNHAMDTNTESCINIELHPQEVAAANSRRAMLQDFLTWSRQFDAAWHEFQLDTWTEAVNANRGAAVRSEQMHIAHGLNALFGHLNSVEFSESSTNSMDQHEFSNGHGDSHGLLQLLLDAKAELCFGHHVS